ncbi:MAG: zinc ribbon domain-containing protein [Oscillospiraceae bacterium]|nr:zinc ribbon domain-containing protein [Oscillospiraceae bacterium]
MKYCSYCGAELLEDLASFCMECGRSIPEREESFKRSSAKPKQKPARKKKRKKAGPPREKPKPRETIPVDDGYDGYYDDIIPDDAGEMRQALDKVIVKKIVLLIAGLLVVVAACVAIMYLL